MKPLTFRYKIPPDPMLNKYIEGAFLVSEVSGWARLSDGTGDVRMKQSTHGYFLDKDDMTRFVELWTATFEAA